MSTLRVGHCTPLFGGVSKSPAFIGLERGRRLALSTTVRYHPALKHGREHGQPMRSLHRLSAVKVINVKQPGYYADGGNLYLRVAPGGTKGWIFRNLSKVPDLRLIQDYLGHKNIKNTARYTRTSARRFEGLWD
jgi:hypothetical protein